MTPARHSHGIEACLRAAGRGASLSFTLTDTGGVRSVLYFAGAERKAHAVEADYARDAVAAHEAYLIAQAHAKTTRITSTIETTTQP